MNDKGYKSIIFKHQLVENKRIYDSYDKCVNIFHKMWLTFAIYYI